MDNNVSIETGFETIRTRATVTNLTPEFTDEPELIDFLTLLTDIENK